MLSHEQNRFSPPDLLDLISLSPFKVDDDYLGKLQDCFGVIRSVNKSDVLTLASNFGSVKAVCDASADDLAQCPGLGDKKVARIHEALHEPLVRKHSRSKRSRTEG